MKKHGRENHKTDGLLTKAGIPAVESEGQIGK